MRVWDDDVVFPNGRSGSHVRIESARKGRGAVVLVRAADRIALVRVYRYPTDAWEWALPRGFSDEEESTATAVREVAEELGLEGVSPLLLGTVTPDSGLMSTHVDIHRVTLDELPTTVTHDTEEVHEVAWVGASELHRRITEGQINDAYTLAAVALDCLNP
ncbi:NUDIX hydrolase [Serinicoccus marinus]|uniref:NUDIX hydrolase n=1 Tax=Serinicoccus marinus TaxID=247333 RepID=UPI001375C317|nr:NUDIX hydrolase [Serinicoccus marinus]